MQSVAQDSLRSRSENNEASAVGQHQADAGSDAYEKDFALSLLSQEQDALYEIEEALKRIEVGTYGVCEMSSKAIPHARLEAIPFARFTVECQQQLEKENRGRRRWDTAPQFMDSAEAFADEEEESADDDDKKKEKTRVQRTDYASRRQTHPAPPPHATLARQAPHRHQRRGASTSRTPSCSRNSSRKKAASCRAASPA